MKPTPLAIGGRVLGPGQPCLVVAHAGHAHHGSKDQALRLIEAAFQAGADAIAFSIFRTDELVVRRHPERTSLEQLELPARDWKRILEAGRASGLAVVAEAYDGPSRDVALEAGVSALLSHASDVDHPELLKTLGGGGVPFLLAAGEADDALLREALVAAGGEAGLVLGPTVAPAPVEELRLSGIAAARERFRTSVGVLDPTDGGSAFALVAPALAVAHGAEFVLKRLVFDRGERGRDGASAVSPEELHRCVELLRQAERAAGEGPGGAERATGRSIVAATLVGRGDVLTAEHLRYKRTPDRPGGGLRPSDALRVIGRRAARPIQADEAIREDMLE